MKIAMVIDRLIPGGAENVCVDIINRFQSDFNFELITITQNEEENLDTMFNVKIRVLKLNRKFKFHPITAFILHKKLSDYDILHVHLKHTFRYVAWIKLLFRGKYKIILHDHEGSIYIDEKPPFFEYRILKPDYYIGVCDKLKFWARTIWNIEEHKSTVLLNLPFYERRKNNFIVNPEFSDLILVGNIKPIKNQFFAADLAKKLDRKISFFGNNQNMEYFKKLQPQENIKLMVGVNVNSEILQKHKFGLCTSISESGPLVVLEYLMAGIPFLAYKVGGMSEAISEYFPEYFIDNLNLNNWIKKIKELEENPIQIDLYNERISRLLMDKFDPEDYKIRLNQIYNSIS
jgi:glycosyltransferase involved in cell wall biosynthesis